MYMYIYKEEEREREKKRIESMYLPRLWRDDNKKKRGGGYRECIWG